MHTIAHIQKNMKEFDAYARRIAGKKAPEPDMQKKWRSLFQTELTMDSAISFKKYYRSMRSQRRLTKKQKGGMAPLAYAMTPGLNQAVYGKFPVAIHTDPQSIQDLDVYFQNSLTKGCGTENSSLTIPEGMGSNMVGGRSRKNRKNARSATRKDRKNRKVNRKVDRKNRKTGRKNARTNRKTNRKNRKQRGGLVDVSNLGISLYSRPYLADAPPNYFQSMGAAASGSTTPVPGPSSPVSHTWGYLSSGTSGLINPGAIASNGNIKDLASPAPWQSSAN